jgi:hypothetical protein
MLETLQQECTGIAAFETALTASAATDAHTVCLQVCTCHIHSSTLQSVQRLVSVQLLRVLQY